MTLQKTAIVHVQYPNIIIIGAMSKGYGLHYTDFRRRVVAIVIYA
jgi:hypothetical protein